MSWRLKKKYQGLLAEERGTVRKDWGGKIAFALVYPNTYAVGMSNLGFQTIYRHLNALPDVVCERVFLPNPEDADEMRRSGTSPFSLESLRPLGDFQMIGFSVTYEGDYINVLRLLAMASIPLRAAAGGGDQAAAQERECVRDGRGGEDPACRVRPHGAPRGGQGVRPGMPLLPRGAGVPPGETPQRGRASGDRRPDGGQRRAPRGAGRGVRVGLSVDWR